MKHVNSHTSTIFRLGMLAMIGLLSICTVGAAADPIKTLIVDGQNNHNWAETTPILKAMMETCGRFTVDVS